MAIEIEAKLRCENPESLRRRLRELGAEYVGQVMESNIFLDTQDESLRAGDCGLRLRVNRDLADDSQRIVLTYKGPRRPGVLKSREEIELRVDDQTSAVALFERLGFVRTLTFEKRRQTWRLDGCSVELDELPHIGTFVEIEGSSEAQVLALQKRLGLADQPNIDTPYVGLLAAYMREQRMTNRAVTFNDTDVL